MSDTPETLDASVKHVHAFQVWAAMPNKGDWRGLQQRLNALVESKALPNEYFDLDAGMLKAWSVIYQWNDRYQEFVDVVYNQVNGRQAERAAEGLTTLQVWALEEISRLHKSQQDDPNLRTVTRMSDVKQLLEILKGASDPDTLLKLTSKEGAAAATQMAEGKAEKFAKLTHLIDELDSP